MPSTIHNVQPGDCFSSLAKLYGFPDWKPLYNHGDNAELKEKRKDPNILFPGDQVTIPEKDKRTESAATGQRHKFILHREPVMLRIVLKDSDDKPFANKKFELNVENKITKGTTDGDGLMEAKIPAEARAANLTLFLDGGPGDTGCMFPLELGHLDPADERSGVVARLNNLGYEWTNQDDSQPDGLSGALKAFQKKNNLPVTGDLDDATRQKLKEQHD